MIAQESSESPNSIVFNQPYTSEKAFDYIKASHGNAHTCGDGPFTKRSEKLLEGLIGCRRALLTTSCTDALEMAALLLNIKPGDEVIVPSFTFVSTVNAFVLHGATPVFCDIREDTLNIDETLIPKLITKRTKAIVPVHYAGVSCEMTSIMDTANSHGLWVVEDNAHGLFGSYQSKMLGTFGHLATQSFHETKNFSCGEGGALLINDQTLVQRAEIIREKGTNRSQFYKGLVDKYSWVDLGSSYLPSDILAAYLYAQLEEREKIQEIRRKAWNYYYKNLETHLETYGIRLPVVPESVNQPYHMFYIICSTEQHRDSIISYMRNAGISTPFHYLPLHLSVMGKRLGGTEGMCPNTEDLSSRLFRLPLHNVITKEIQDRVINTLIAAFKKCAQ